MLAFIFATLLHVPACGNTNVPICYMPPVSTEFTVLFSVPNQPSVALTQDTPTSPIRVIVVPLPPGGGR